MNTYVGNAYDNRVEPEGGCIANACFADVGTCTYNACTINEKSCVMHGCWVNKK